MGLPMYFLQCSTARLLFNRGNNWRPAKLSFYFIWLKLTYVKTNLQNIFKGLEKLIKSNKFTFTVAFSHFCISWHKQLIYMRPAIWLQLTAVALRLPKFDTPVIEIMLTSFSVRMVSPFQTYFFRNYVHVFLSCLSERVCTTYDLCSENC